MICQPLPHYYEIMAFELTTDTARHGAVASSTGQVPTLNVDMSLLRSHRLSSVTHDGMMGGAVAEGGGGGIVTAAAPAMPTSAAAAAAATAARPAARFGLSGSSGGSGSGTMGGTTTAGPYDTSGSTGIGLTLGGGGDIADVGHGSRSGGGGGMTMMTTTATTGGMLLMEGAPVQTVGGDSMIGGGAGEDDATAGTTAPGGGGSGGDDDAAEASDSTNSTAAGEGVVAIPGPPDVEAALQDVVSLMREVEHTLEDVRMMTVENAILMDSLALVGADV